MVAFVAAIAPLLVKLLVSNTPPNSTPAQMVRSATPER